MVICVDVDDVCCNLQETVIDIFNNKFGSSYTLEDFTEFDIMNVWYVWIV